MHIYGLFRTPASSIGSEPIRYNTVSLTLPALQCNSIDFSSAIHSQQYLNHLEICHFKGFFEWRSIRSLRPDRIRKERVQFEQQLASHISFLFSLSSLSLQGAQIDINTELFYLMNGSMATQSACMCVSSLQVHGFSVFFSHPRPYSSSQRAWS